jgi:hypothetical protein
MTSALFTRITPGGHVVLTLCDLGPFRIVVGRYENFATTEEAGVD